VRPPRLNRGVRRLVATFEEDHFEVQRAASRETLMNKIVLLLMLIASTVPAVRAASAADQASASTFDAVVAGMHCEQNPMGSLECEYHVGKSLYFGVVGVGDPDAAITFYSVSFDGDYYASVGVPHGCVVVKPGKTTGLGGGFAFVSPRNGKAYHDWQSCSKAK